MGLPTARESDVIAELRGRALVDLVRPCLPVDIEVDRPANAWPLVGPGLIARQAGTLEAILTLIPLDREADATVLVRSLYEHAVTFAWLAADPGEERLSRWVRSDRRQRLEIDDDSRQVGAPLLVPEAREQYEQTVESLPSDMPNRRQRAEVADAHWGETISGLETGTPMSFRGLYATAYRHHSSIAHPSDLGLNRVAVDLEDGRTRVQLEKRDPEARGPFGLATVIFGLALLVAAESLGWPTRASIEAVFDRYQERQQ